jgi:uncharacterized damage-inducible protein DinB
MSEATVGNSVLANLFRQNQWATLTTIDACLGIDAALVDAEAPGTVGTIRETLWHMVEADNHFLAALKGNPDAAHIPPLDIPGGDLGAIRGHVVRIGDDLVACAECIHGDPMLEGEWGHGPYRVPASMFAAQAIHHGTTHRWQIGEALARFGVDSPDTDGWSWWESRAANSDGGTTS